MTLARGSRADYSPAMRHMALLLVLLAGCSSDEKKPAPPPPRPTAPAAASTEPAPPSDDGVVVLKGSKRSPDDTKAGAQRDDARIAELERRARDSQGKGSPAPARGSATGPAVGQHAPELTPTSWRKSQPVSLVNPRPGYAGTVLVFPERFAPVLDELEGLERRDYVVIGVLAKAGEEAGSDHPALRWTACVDGKGATLKAYGVKRPAWFVLDPDGCVAARKEGTPTAAEVDSLLSATKKVEARPAAPTARGKAPELTVSNWKNSEALTLEKLQGSVVLIDFLAHW